MKLREDSSKACLQARGRVLVYRVIVDFVEYNIGRGAFFENIVILFSDAIVLLLHTSEYFRRSKIKPHGTKTLCPYIELTRAAAIRKHKCIQIQATRREPSRNDSSFQPWVLSFNNHFFIFPLITRIPHQAQPKKVCTQVCNKRRSGITDRHFPFFTNSINCEHSSLTKNKNYYEKKIR